MPRTQRPQPSQIEGPLRWQYFHDREGVVFHALLLLCAMKKVMIFDVEFEKVMSLLATYLIGQHLVKRVIFDDDAVCEYAVKYEKVMNCLVVCCLITIVEKVIPEEMALARSPRTSSRVVSSGVGGCSVKDHKLNNNRIIRGPSFCKVPVRGGERESS